MPGTDFWNDFLLSIANSEEAPQADGSAAIPDEFLQ
jgi:hypothetical protein